MCVKTLLTRDFRKLIAAISAIKKINCLTALVVWFVKTVIMFLVCVNQVKANFFGIFTGTVFRNSVIMFILMLYL